MCSRLAAGARDAEQVLACALQGKKMEELPVTFEDVQIRQAVTAEEGQKVALAVLIAPDHRFNVRGRRSHMHACLIHACLPPLRGTVLCPCRCHALQRICQQALQARLCGHSSSCGGPGHATRSSLLPRCARSCVAGRALCRARCRGALDDASQAVPETLDLCGAPPPQVLHSGDLICEGVIRLQPAPEAKKADAAERAAAEKEAAPIPAEAADAVPPGKDATPGAIPSIPVRPPSSVERSVSG